MSEFRTAISPPSSLMEEATTLHAGRDERPAEGIEVSPSRIVHLIKHCSYGNGSVHVAVDLACLQASQGHEVAFVSAGGTFVPLLEHYGVQHVYLPHEGNKPLDLLKSTWALVRLASRMKATVLHAHMMTSAIIGYAASKLTGIPMVTTVHNSFDRHSTIMRLGNRVVAVSGAEKLHLLERGYKPSQVDVVINAPARSPRDGFLSDSVTPLISSPCITTVCGLHRRKGVFDLIAACGTLLHELPEWRLYIAGEGPDREALEAQAEALGLADKVIFLGFVRDPRELLEKSDIFVLASYADPCSLAVGEARVAGCAIVASNVGGTPEMLEFGEAGRLFAPGDVGGLRAALLPLMVDKDARMQLRRRSLHGSEQFYAERLVVEYDQVYRRAR